MSDETEAAATVRKALGVHDGNCSCVPKQCDACAALTLLVERAAASQPSLFQIRCDLNWAIGYASTSPLDGWTEPLVEGLQSIADRLTALAAGSEGET